MVFFLHQISPKNTLVSGNTEDKKNLHPGGHQFLLSICLNFLNNVGLGPVYQVCMGSNYTLYLTFISNSSQKDKGMMQLLIRDVILPKRVEQTFIRSYWRTLSPVLLLILSIALNITKV